MEYLEYLYKTRMQWAVELMFRAGKAALPQNKPDRSGSWTLGQHLSHRALRGSERQPPGLVVRWSGCQRPQ